MLPQKQAEEAIVSSYNETEIEGKEEEKEEQSILSVKSLLWHGGSVYDAWFSCASNQVKKKKKNTNSAERERERDLNLCDL